MLPFLEPDSHLDIFFSEYGRPEIDDITLTGKAQAVAIRVRRSIAGTNHTFYGFKPYFFTCPTADRAPDSSGVPGSSSANHGGIQIIGLLMKKNTSNLIIS